METGYIFDIERFATGDGPGIRTVVFLKGCPLRCLWCCNPESQRTLPDILLYADKCAGCGRCITACPQKALESKEGRIRWDSALCNACGNCEETCYHNAVKLSGRLYAVDEVVDRVNRDRGFYERSGGGVTFSGGEPVLQGSFLAALLRAAKESGLHTAVESCGLPSPVWAHILPDIDLLYLDFKHVDPAKYRAQLGVDYPPYLENIGRLAGAHPNVVFRVPCVPGFNHTEKDYEQIAAAIAELGGSRRVELLPYHRLGRDKYYSLGLGYPLEGVAQMAKSQLIPICEIFKQHGLDAVVIPE